MIVPFVFLNAPGCAYGTGQIATDTLLRLLAPDRVWYGKQMINGWVVASSTGRLVVVHAVTPGNADWWQLPNLGRIQAEKWADVIAYFIV